MEAILWDGNKQIHGNLEAQSTLLVFRLNDFADSNLELKIHYTDILKVRYQKIYQLSLKGVIIQLKNGKQNVFIVDRPGELKEMVDKRMDL